MNLRASHKVRVRVAVVSAVLALSGLTACSSNSEANAPAPSVTATESPTPTQASSKAPKAEATTSPTQEAAESATPDIERTPLRDWKGLEMLDNLPEDRGESINKIREFIMLNDPECDLTAERIAASTTWGNFTDTGEQLMKALNVVGSMYSDYTVPGNEKKVDALIDGLTSYHSPEAARALKDFMNISFLACEFHTCSPEAANHRFDNAAVTQLTDQVQPMFAEDGEPYQGFELSIKLQRAHDDLGVPSAVMEPTLTIAVNVGGVITDFAVER